MRTVTFWVCPHCEEEYDRKKDAEECAIDCARRLDVEEVEDGLWECPICNSEYATEQEADDCLDDCQWEAEPEQRTEYACGRCGSRFTNAPACREHEASCERQFDPEVLELQSCDSCERCTREGYFAVDCKRAYRVLPREHCPNHQPARA